MNGSDMLDYLLGYENFNEDLYGIEPDIDDQIKYESERRMIIVREWVRNPYMVKTNIAGKVKIGFIDMEDIPF